MADEVDIDLTLYKDRVGQRITPGRYRVVVDDVESDTASSGNPMINVWLRVVGGEFDGAVVLDRLVITERSLFRVVGFMQAIGLPTPKKRLRVNVRQFLNKQLEIDVDDGDPYMGRVKSEVRGYIRLTRAPAGAADLPDESSFDVFKEGAESPDSTAAVDVPADSGEVDLDAIDLG